MVASRIYYSNFLTQQTFSAFNVGGGAVAMAAGSYTDPYDYSAGTVGLGARLNPTTGFTNVFEKDFVLEIHVCPDGSFPTTRWRWSDQGGYPNWNQEDLVPVSGVWVPLSSGVEIQFVQSGFAPEFVLGDFWYARVLRPFGIAKAIDGSRNSEYRSGTTPASSTIRAGWDVGSAKQPTFFALDDHNIPSTATTTLYAHPTTLFTESGGFSLPCTWRPNRIAELITSNAFRYWWWKVVMPASGQPSYLRYSEAFLGTGATLSKCPDIGFSNNLEFLGSIDMPNVATRGPHPRLYTAAQPQYTWSLVKDDPTEDGGKLAAALAYARDHASYTMPPLWFLLRDDQVGNAEYYSWSGNGLGRTHRFLDRWDITVNWAQVIRTVAA